MKKSMLILLVISGLSVVSCTKPVCTSSNYDVSLKIFAYTNDPIIGTPMKKMPFLLNTSDCATASQKPITKTETLFTGDNGRIDTIIKVTESACDYFSCQPKLTPTPIISANQVLVNQTSDVQKTSQNFSFQFK